MLLERLYDEDLAQGAWLIGCQETREAIIIDPQRDVCRYIKAAEDAKLTIKAVAETHIHADFLSGSAALAGTTGATCYLSNCGGPDWLYAWPEHSDVDVSFVEDGDTINVGRLTLRVLHTPGHTPEHICFLVYDKDAIEPIGLATGDFVFVGDLGRPDLLETAAGIDGVMESAAIALHASCKKLKRLPDFLQVWPGHGAGSSCGKALGAVPQSTLGYEQRMSPPLQLVGNEQAFVEHMLTGQPEPPLYFARMKRMNRDGVPKLDGFPIPKRIEDPVELQEAALLYTVIDTRDWNDVRNGHLPGTIWSRANAEFHRFAGSFVEESEEILFIVREENLDRAIRNAIRIGLDRIVAWATPETVSSISGLETMNEIDSQELSRRNYDSLLDVRRLSEFQGGAIEGAINIAHTRLMGRLDQIDTSTSWVVHCYGGGRSAAACMALKRKGFKVTNLSGGYRGWLAANRSSIAST